MVVMDQNQISFPGPFPYLVLNKSEREPGNEVEIMDDIQGLKIPSPGHPVITRQLAPDGMY